MITLAQNSRTRGAANTPTGGAYGGRSRTLATSRSSRASSCISGTGFRHCGHVSSTSSSASSRARLYIASMQPLHHSAEQRRHDVQCSRSASVWLSGSE